MSKAEIFSEEPDEVSEEPLEESEEKVSESKSSSSWAPERTDSSIERLREEDR